MTRKIAGTCFAALLGFALSAAGQTPPSSSPQTPSTPQTPQTSPYPSSSSQSEKGDKADKAKGSKLTGCIQSGTTAGTYELTNIKGKGSMASESSASGGASKSVKLVAAAGVDLSQHVGHQVEVNGSWSAAAPSAAPSAGAPSSGGDKEFNVTDVKMVSSTCTAGTN